MRAERAAIERLFGSLIDDRALVARKRHAVLLVLEEVLAKLGADVLEDEADMGRNGIVAEDGMFGLEEVAHAECRASCQYAKRSTKVDSGRWIAPYQAGQRSGAGKGERQQQIARCERKQQVAHGGPSLRGTQSANGPF